MKLCSRRRPRRRVYRQADSRTGTHEGDVAMAVFDWIIAGIILVVVVYLSFVLTLADYLVALKKGQAVTLLPERRGGTWPLWTQIAIVILGLALCVPLFYFLWIPLIKFSIPLGRILDI